jgi:hypothetical protein
MESPADSSFLPQIQLLLLCVSHLCMSKTPHQWSSSSPLTCRELRAPDACHLSLAAQKQKLGGLHSMKSSSGRVHAPLPLPTPQGPLKGRARPGSCLYLRHPVQGRAQRCGIPLSASLHLPISVSISERFSLALWLPVSDSVSVPGAFLCSLVRRGLRCRLRLRLEQNGCVGVVKGDRAGQVSGMWEGQAGWDLPGLAPEPPARPLAPVPL